MMAKRIAEDEGAREQIDRKPLGPVDKPARPTLNRLVVTQRDVVRNQRRRQAQQCNQEEQQGSETQALQPFSRGEGGGPITQASRPAEGENREQYEDVPYR